MFFMADFMHVAEFGMQLILEFQGELIRLYVQKGHDPAACRRFLKKVHPPRFTCADSGVLCVSSPVSKGYSTYLSLQFQAGGQGLQR